MLAPCSGIRGGPRKIARPAKCGGPGANNHVSGAWLYISLCCGFILLYAPAFLSLLGKLWRRPRGLLVICLFSLVSCELLVSMRVIHQKQLKLSELYATLYRSLCRCLIPPLYTMFMTTTLCHNCPFCWMLQVVTLCCLMLRHPYVRNVSHFTLCSFMPKV